MTHFDGPGISQSGMCSEEQEPPRGRVHPEKRSRCSADIRSVGVDGCQDQKLAGAQHQSPAGLGRFLPKWGDEMKTLRGRSLAGKAVVCAAFFLLGGGAGRSVNAAPSYNFTTIDVPSSVRTEAYDINDAGQVVGSYIDHTGAIHGFLYSGGAYTTLPFPATGINNVGQIVMELVGSGSALYTGGSYTPINAPLGVRTYALHVNDSGKVVGSYYDSIGTLHGFLYSDGTYTTVDNPLGFIRTETFGINNAGQIVGYFMSGVAGEPAQQGFNYRGGVFTTINDPRGLSPQSTQSAWDINDNGQIVGSVNGSGYVYDAGAFTPLDHSLGVLTNAYGNNNLGQIAGYYATDTTPIDYGSFSTPHYLGFVASVPEPATYCVMILGLAMICFSVRWRNKALLARPSQFGPLGTVGCGGELKIIAAILETLVIQRILEYLGLVASALARAHSAASYLILGLKPR